MSEEVKPLPPHLVRALGMRQAAMPGAEEAMAQWHVAASASAGERAVTVDPGASDSKVGAAFGVGVAALGVGVAFALLKRRG